MSIFTTIAIKSTISYYICGMNYFQKLLHLLKIEREEDRKSYIKSAASANTVQRRASGQTWYPIAIRGKEIGQGEYLTVEVERTTHHELVHQFRFGASAALFSNLDPSNDRISGNISHISGDRLKITFRTDELPNWTNDGKLGIDLLFDEYSYDEMQQALNRAAKLFYDKTHSALMQVVIGEKPPAFDLKEPYAAAETLNTAQQSAVLKIVSAKELAIIHGPPGTGKTTTLIQSVKALLLQQSPQILVAAPSNTAVDLLTEKLAEQGLNVVRIGNPLRVSAQLASQTLDHKTALHPQMKYMRKMKKQANQFREMAHRYKRSFGKSERDQRKALLTEARNIMEDVDKTEKMIVQDILDKAQVITATLVGANHYTLRDRVFETVFIDEAAQALEPACWIPILKASKLVLAGDHLQLPPTLKSDEAAKDLSKTLFEKCVLLWPQAVVFLNQQYRMHQAIMAFPSKKFYNNNLYAHPSVAKELLFLEDLPVQFIDTAGCGFDEKVDGTQIGNPEEASFLFTYLIPFICKLENYYPLELFPTIAIISPYKEQISILKELYEQSSLMKYQDKISINTIDSFQGQERDVVCLSMTRSNTNNKIGFLSDLRRMNVAMTRAKKKLIVIGDSTTLSQLSFYRDFITNAEEKGGYHSAWEFINA